MGTVWRARNLQLDVPVAVKVMAPRVATSPGFVARFEREAKAAAQIRSPHVVTVHEHGVHEGLPYMVMELLEGEDLHQRLKRDERISLAATSRIVRDVCRALHRAHDLGIVHRDLKPANIFLARDLDEEVVKVLDFGIAKLTNDDGSRITATGEMIGTPHYMSPEQVRAAKDVDHRADLWAVGAIAYRCLTGKLPFNGTTLEVVQQIIHDRAPPPSRVAPHLPAALDAFFDKALAPEIERRFQSARELSDALAAIAAAAPSSEAPRPAAEPTGITTDEVPTVAIARESEKAAKPAAKTAEPAATVVEGQPKTLALEPAAPAGAVRLEAPRAAPEAMERTRELDVAELDLPPSLPWPRGSDARAASSESAAPASSGSAAKSAPSATMATVVARRSRLVWAVAALVVAAIAFALWKALHGA